LFRAGGDGVNAGGGAANDLARRVDARPLGG
jgi:hypothetical protein